MPFGAIADDITGGTDLASVLRRAGLSVVQTVGIPRRQLPQADAVVVSLKTRTAPVDVATSLAKRAADFLARVGAAQLYFKYCSTFDSTDSGNIGPVIEALLELQEASFTVACPAYPALGRTSYLGYLFVGDRLLSESSMKDHPLTPMTDANLVRVLQRQTRLRVGLAALGDVGDGPATLRKRLDRLRNEGERVVLVDAFLDRHIEAIAAASAELSLATGGAALGGALGKLVAGRTSNSPARTRTIRPCRPVAVLSGSCSAATRAQVSHLAAHIPSRALDPKRLAESAQELQNCVEWACGRVQHGNVLVRSLGGRAGTSEGPNELATSEAARLIENAFREIARALAAAGVRTFIVAGGETLGAVLEALEIELLEFGDEIDPGVPWVFADEPSPFSLALKSGNFGSETFFSKALQGTA